MLAVATAVIIFVVVMLISRYFSGPGTTKVASSKAGAPVSVTQLMPTFAESLAGFQLFMSRCKQIPSCPYYALSVKGNTLEYLGVRDVATRGKIEQPLSTDHKRKFLKLVKKTGFFALHDAYDLRSPGCQPTRMDAPTVTIGVTLNGRTKVIKVNQACVNIPARLSALARSIDRISGSARWTGTGAGRGTDVGAAAATAGSQP